MGENTTEWMDSWDLNK